MLGFLAVVMEVCSVRSSSTTVLRRLSFATLMRWVKATNLACGIRKNTS